MQLNLAQGSAQNGAIKDQDWWRRIIKLGLAPTLILLILALLFNKTLMLNLFHYRMPPSQEIYVILFFIGTMIGQVGNMFSIILRARKKSHLVTLIYYTSDLVFLLGIMQILILLHWQSPLTVGITTLIYSLAYTGMNLFFCIKAKYEKTH